MYWEPQRGDMSRRPFLDTSGGRHCNVASAQIATATLGLRPQNRTACQCPRLGQLFTECIHCSRRKLHATHHAPGRLLRLTDEVQHRGLRKSPRSATHRTSAVNASTRHTLGACAEQDDTPEKCSMQRRASCSWLSVNEWSGASPRACNSRCLLRASQSRCDHGSQFRIFP
jgi:hypothetical protein